jgi:ABC-2 type transport system ATP-binding protein
VTELGRAGVTVGEFALGQPSLDEVFLALTGQPATNSAPAAAGTTATGSPASVTGSPATVTGSPATPKGSS